VHVSYLEGDTTHYWTVSVFSTWTVTFDGAWQNAIGTETWRYPFDGANWVSDKEYTLRVRAFDKAEPMDAKGGNEQNPWTVRTFTVDGTPPISRVSTPTAGSYIQSTLPQLSGTSYGGTSALRSDSTGLKLRIYYISGADTWYWKGTTALGWSSPTVVELPVDFTASASTITWSYPPVGYDMPAISVHNQVYNVSIAGLDQSGNQESPAAIAVTSDLNYPVVTISTPMAATDGFYSDVRPVTVFTGNTADSPAAIAPPVKIEISKLLPDRAVEKKWDGSQWSVLGSTWLAVNSVNPWDINSPALGKNKRYKTELLAKDNAGNQTPTGGAGAVYREFIYDTNKPSTTINVPNLAYHNRAQITTLSGAAVDWVNLSTESYSGIAPSGVEIQLVDVTGGNAKYNGSGAFNAADNWRPLSITYYGGSDAYFGVQLSSSVSWSYPAGDTWPPALNEGSSYKVRVRAKDRSQNLEDYVERQFVYDNYSPTTTVTMPGAAAYASMPAILGDFTESVSGINTGDGIQVALKRNSDGSYWDGNVWISTGFTATNWRSAGSVNSPSWTYTDTALNNYFNTLAGSLEFTVYVRGRDVVGNKNAPDTPAPAGGVVFKMDRFIPVSLSTWPALGAGAIAYLNAPVSNLAGTAVDADPGYPSGLNNVYVRVRRFNS
ncbi:MAG: hypothetical protein AAB359_06885, partial [Elusimicrobiota bacterium]